MGYWDPRLDRNRLLEEVPSILSLLDDAHIDGRYVWHGLSAGMLHRLERFGMDERFEKDVTRDIDIMVPDHHDIARIYSELEKSRHIRGYSGHKPLNGGDKLRGIDIYSDEFNIEIRNPNYFTNSVDAGERDQYEVLTLDKERFGYLEDLHVNVRPYGLLLQDFAAMEAHFSARALHHRLFIGQEPG